MEPLASRIRPRKLDEFVGQEHLTGKGKPLRVAIEKKELFSFILWGPPGSGKTTLARIYANAVGAEFHELSAVEAGKDDIRKIIGTRQLTLGGKPKALFVDEIHRFNKHRRTFCSLSLSVVTSRSSVRRPRIRHSKSFPRSFHVPACSFSTNIRKKKWKK